MSISTTIYIGVDITKEIYDDLCWRNDTVAPTKKLCRERIVAAGLNPRHVVPVAKTLILKGRLDSRY